MAQESVDWSPPKEVQDLVVASLPDGVQWYECRTRLKVLSYTIDRYDDALQDTKALKRIFKAELFYCYKKDGVLTAERVW